jgi:hypothetical protein
LSILEVEQTFDLLWRLFLETGGIGKRDRRPFFIESYTRIRDEERGRKRCTSLVEPRPTTFPGNSL